jgi:hypothetical protein
MSTTQVQNGSGNIVNQIAPLLPAMTIAALQRAFPNGTWAFLSGRLKILGDRAFAKKVERNFPLRLSRTACRSNRGGLPEVLFA